MCIIDKFAILCVQHCHKAIASRPPMLSDVCPDATSNVTFPVWLTIGDRAYYIIGFKCTCIFTFLPVANLFAHVLPIYVQIQRGDTTAVEHSYRAGKAAVQTFTVNTRNPLDSDTMLIRAAHFGHVQLVQRLLALGADPQLRQTVKHSYKNGYRYTMIYLRVFISNRLNDIGA